MRGASGWLAAAVMALTVAGCAGDASAPADGTRGKGDAGPDGARPSDAGATDGDVGGPSDTGVDSGAADSGDLGDSGGTSDLGLHGFLDPCEGGDDCLSGYCVDTDDGPRCTRTCNDDCPEGWECRQVRNSGEDMVFLCVPAAGLCEPCDTSDDCGGSGDLCLAIGDGTYCGRDCSGEQGCPEGYTCRDLDDLGDGVRQCVPSDGWCTPCRDEDHDGHVGGEGCEDSMDPDDHDPDVYLGAPELCDGKDNDGDSEIDEGFDFASDPEHCGSCDRVCSYDHAVAGCRQGECVMLGCEEGWIDCENGAEDGCERPCQVTLEGREACDGVDNDCDCEVDEGFDLGSDPENCGGCGRRCPTAGCEQDGDGFVAWGDSLCRDGECVEPERFSCGLYTCIQGGAQGDRCARSCADDGFCAAAAHCVDGECVPDIPNGEACTEDRDCASGHCANGFCCPDGLCCDGPAACPLDLAEPPVCVEPSTCQGTRLDPGCDEEHRCVQIVVEDDSACGPDVLADDCGSFEPAYCTGELDQEPPVCRETCEQDDQCDEEAHCDDGLCAPDLEDGAECDEDSDCQSGHCGNGFCCEEGDCCADAADCPDEYTAPPTCTMPSSCQGTRSDPVCGPDHRCSSQVVEDDSACDATVLSDGCGLFEDVYCTGGRDQEDPGCPDSCLADDDCDPGAHCDGTCVPDLADGSACDEDSDCASGHCANGFCCQGGDCCQSARDCPERYSAQPVCDDPSTCQGHRVDALCQDNVCGSSGPVDDDTACAAGMLSDECGLYPAVYCTGGADQLDPPCPSTCRRDSDCDRGAHCDDGRCLPDQPAGARCDEPGDCAEGLFCVDGVCCTSACDGLCERCDLTGDGTCAPVPAGQDPDQECGGQSCHGWYWGWDGDRCLERADLSAFDVGCNGAGACQTREELCPSQPAGEPVAVCDPVCQDPEPLTCRGTIGPSCRNLDLGDVTCGVGVCRNTVPRCVNGVQNRCEPLPPRDEVCNDLDDDCDGATDSEDPDLARNDHPLCENQTGVCSGAMKDPSLCVGGDWLQCGSSQYEAASNGAYERGAEVSCDGLDNDCDGSRDEMTAYDEDNCGACGNRCTNDHGSNTCSEGRCRPQCDFLWGDCDADPDNGCETSLSTLSDCGGCGQRCDLAHASESCNQGSCQLGTCDSGYADCDGVGANGCETDLTPSSGAGWDCEHAIDLGEICGDRDSGWLCPDNYVGGPSTTGHGERWFKIKIKECSDCDSDLQINVFLQSPPNMDYDLYLYDACGQAPVEISTNLAGELDSVTDTQNDSWGDSDDRWWYIRAKFYSGRLCSDWRLWVCGGRGCP